MGVGGGGQWVDRADRISVAPAECGRSTGKEQGDEGDIGEGARSKSKSSQLCTSQGFHYHQNSTSCHAREQLFGDW